MCWWSRKVPADRARGIALAWALLIASTPTFAMDVKVRTTTTATVTASNNPRLSTAANVQAMLLEISAEPQLTARSETSSFDASARLAYLRYSRLYGAQKSGNAQLAGTSKRSERLDVNGAANISYGISADAIGDISAAVDPQSTRMSGDVSLGSNINLSEKNSVSPSFRAGRVRYGDSDTLTGYTSLAAGIGFLRRLTTRTSVGVQINGATQRYEQGARSAVIALLANGKASLDEFTTLSGSVGVERPTMSNSLFSFKPRVLLNGDVDLCRRRLRMTLCAVAAARSGASGLGSLQRLVSGGLVFTHEPTERTTYKLNVDYQRSTSLGNENIGTLSYFAAQASFDYEVSEVLTLTGLSSYRRRSGAGTVGGLSFGAGIKFKTGRP